MAVELDSLLTLYGICKKIVAGWPRTNVGTSQIEDRRKRLNTFGVFRSIDDLNADNAMKRLKYSGLDYFFSRMFHESGHDQDKLLIEYPLVGLSEVSFQFFQPLETQKNDLHRLNLIFADRIPQNNETQTSDNELSVNDDRTVEQVGEDLRSFCKTFLHVLGRFVHAEVFTDAVTSIGYQWIDHGDLTLNYHAGYDQTRLAEFISADNPLNGEIVYYATDDNLAILIAQIDVLTRDCVKGIIIDYDYLTETNAGAKIAPQDY